MAFQQQLKTYIDRNNLNYKYEEKQIEEQQFKARVIIYNNDNNNNDTIYEWTDSQISKKIAKNKAAKIVLIKLEIIQNEEENNHNENNNNENNNDNENIKDILIDIRNLLKIMVDRTPQLVW